MNTDERRARCQTWRSKEYLHNYNIVLRKPLQVDSETCRVPKKGHLRGHISSPIKKFPISTKIVSGSNISRSVREVSGPNSFRGRISRSITEVSSSSKGRFRGRISRSNKEILGFSKGRFRDLISRSIREVSSSSKGHFRGSISRSVREGSCSSKGHFRSSISRSIREVSGSSKGHVMQVQL